jgi:hypothetical protein
MADGALFSAADDMHHASVWEGATTVFVAAQSRCDEMDAAAARRGAALLAALATRDGASVATAAEHIVEALGAAAPASASARGGVAEGVVAQRLALTQLLETAAAGGGALLAAVSAAVSAAAARHSDGYETFGPSLLGAARVADLALAYPCASSGSGLPATLVHTLASCADPKLRLRAVACAANVWEAARERWPDAFEPPSADARTLALRIVNVVVETALYDPVGRVRLASMKLVQGLAGALKKAEVLRLALLKLRDKDGPTRLAALRTLASVGGEDGCGHELSAAHVRQVVLRATDAAATSSADGAAELRALAETTLIGFVAAHRAGVADGLSEVRTTTSLCPPAAHGPRPPPGPSSWALLLGLPPSRVRA